MKTLIFLGLFTALMCTDVKAIIHHKQLWKHPEDGHLVLSLGDAHVNDKRSAGQQYDILNLAARTKSRIICEDCCYSVGSCLFGDEPIKYRNIRGLHIWARTVGCNSVNIEFRMPYFAERSSSYAKRVINTVDETESIDDEYTPYYQKALETFNASTRQQLQNLRNYKYLFSSANRALQKATNTSNAPLAICSSMFNSINCVLDMKILQQIAESRKNSEVAIISAGSWHTRNIGKILEENGYECLQQASDPLFAAAEEDGTVSRKLAVSEKTYQTFFDPVSITDAHQAVLQHTISQTPSLRSQAALSYLYTRSKIETSPVGHVLHKIQPVTGYIKGSALAASVFWLGLSTLFVGSIIAEKCEKFLKKQAKKVS